MTAKTLAVLLLLSHLALAQTPQPNPPAMKLDVGNFTMVFDKINGEGGLQTQYSWMLTGSNPQRTEIFYWPADEYQSNMLYQIFNPLVLRDSIIDQNGVKKPMYVATGSAALTNPGTTDWGREVRRYRPPVITVDGVAQNSSYTWYVDPTLKSDIKLEFEDVCGQFGIRSHVEVFGFSTPGHADYFIWKATHKFTGELNLPSATKATTDSLPDQTIKFWWPLSFSLGPSKAGERAVNNYFAMEGVDDLDSWFKRKSELVGGGGTRDTLAVAYYYDWKTTNTPAYTNGSIDDMGDPDRVTGTLLSPQIPGFTLLYADKSAAEKADDLTQPYAMPHAGIEKDLWGRRDIGLLQTYRGDDERGRFPLDPITAGITNKPEKGTMRFITVGPYELTLNRAQHRADSVTFVYAVGSGSIGTVLADSVGRRWLRKEITDAEKDSILLTGRDSLFHVLDRAKWAWDRLSRGLSIPSAPPPPDVTVTSGPGRIQVDWSYPDAAYFKDAATGVDDWYAWRIYRKHGALLVNDPSDQRSGKKWELVAEIRDRAMTSYRDTTVVRGEDYYYAVTAVDDGTQNNSGLDTGRKVESSRYVTRSLFPAAAYAPDAVTERDAQQPLRFALGQNYPNPFNPSTHISFTIPSRAHVRLSVCDVLGREVAVLVDQAMEPGAHLAVWNAQQEPSGVYFCRIQAGPLSSVKAMVLQK